MTNEYPYQFHSSSLSENVGATPGRPAGRFARGSATSAEPAESALSLRGRRCDGAKGSAALGSTSVEKFTEPSTSTSHLFSAIRVTRRSC